MCSGFRVLRVGWKVGPLDGLRVGVIVGDGVGKVDGTADGVALLVETFGLEVGFRIGRA